jgi:hypothetical protein
LRQMPIALVTCHALPELTDDDQLILPGLAARGVDAELVVWDDPAVDWGIYDAIIIRSPWDYSRKAEAFARWIDRLDAEGVPLWNPVSVVRPNLNKRYLAALERVGVPIVPTAWLDAGSHVDLAALAGARGWDALVIKPVVSAGARRTWRVRADAQGTLDALVAECDVMVQPYLAEVETRGEWSLVYFRDGFSHGVQKRPKAGDFRVQPQHGGESTRATPPASVRAAAERLLATVRDPWLYARVDGIEVGGQFLLMELEMIEPRLFFTCAPEAADRFAGLVAEVAG